MSDKLPIKDISDLKDKEKRAQFVLLKAKKLAAALYVVTNYLPDTEPIKWRLREAALNLLSDISNLFHLSGREFFVLDKTLSDINKIISLMEIASLNQAASEMNYNLLRQEYLLLKRSLESQNEPQTLSEAKIVVLPSEIEAKVPEIQNSKPKIQSIPASHTSSPNQDRQKKILDFLRLSGWSPVAQVAKAVPGVSDKTVQRDLVEMLNRGLVKREGERRWSRYAVID